MDTHDKKEKGFVLWFTGLPCSGKTTVADMLAGYLKETGKRIEHLDGDIVRKSLSSDLGFSRHDRCENLKRVIFVAGLLSRNDIGVITTFVSPYNDIREKARHETTNYLEVFVDCPLEVCKKRDVKGMYKLAGQGEISDFTGISSPYERPLSPDITIYTDKETPEESCKKIISYLKEKKII